MIIFSSLIFLLSLLGFYINSNRNILLILVVMELMFLSLNVHYLFLSVYIDDISAQLFSLFILNVAASESAIALSVLVVYYKVGGLLVLDNYKYLKG